MDKKVKISPEELYIIGKTLNAKYIDYAYVATIKEIGASFDLFEKEATDGLVSKGIMVEDFSGNVMLKDEVQELFKPVFFGEIETSLDLCKVFEPKTITTMKFHFYENSITKISYVDGLVVAESVSKEDIKKTVKEIVCSDLTEQASSESEFNKEKVEKLIVAKSNRISKEATIASYLESEHRIYVEDKTGPVICLDPTAFLNEILNVILEVV